MRPRSLHDAANDGFHLNGPTGFQIHEHRRPEGARAGCLRTIVCQRVPDDGLDRFVIEVRRGDARGFCSGQHLTHDRAKSRLTAGGVGLAQRLRDATARQSADGRDARVPVRAQLGSTAEA
jgi:hypothetical protein